MRQTKALMVSEGQAHAIRQRFRLSVQKDWLRDVERSAVFPHTLIVPEGSDFYEYVEKSGLGLELEIPMAAI